MQVTLKNKDIVEGIALYLQKQGFANVRAENLDVTFSQGRKDKNGLTAEVDIGALTTGEARKGTADLETAKAQLGAATLADTARADLSVVEKAKGERANTTADVAPETPLANGAAEVAEPVGEQVVADPVTPVTDEPAPVTEPEPAADPVVEEPATEAPVEEKPATEGKSLFG